MCGIGNWRCPYRDSYEYYVKLNDKNEVIESSLDGKFKNIKGFKIKKRKYQGCPKFNSHVKDEFLEEKTDEFLD